jgi:hypothetical protein
MDKYFKYLDEASQFNYDHCANQNHRSRAYTFKYVWDEMIKLECPTIIELGTTRSFLHGGVSEGCMVADKKYWHPEQPENLDWSAGNFTFVFGQLPNKELHTVDINPNHIWISKTMTEEFTGMHYHVSDSVEFLKNFKGQVDLIYSDSGDVGEETARLHEREANIIVERELVRIGGLILMDDVRSNVAVTQFGERSLFGKDKYSIGIFLANGFDWVCDDYQIILKRMR